MLDTLSRVPLFDGLPVDELTMLEPLFQAFNFAEGDVIFEQGDFAVYLYLVVSGTVEITYKPYDDEPIGVGRVTAGNVFGWSALLGSTLYTSSAVSREPCATLRVRGEDLRFLCTDRPETGKLILDRLATSVSSRWHHAGEQISTILANNISGQAACNSK
jgi:CRP/FNR family cyclic AMP-dependent transcriptional regulator